MISQLRDRVTTQMWLVRTLVRSGFLGSLRVDRYVRMGLNLRRHGGASPVSGIGLAAARDPDGLALIDEAGQLTWRELDARCDALAVGLRDLPGTAVGTVAILCRNHRGLIEALAATSRLGADAVLLNTGFAGPQLADVLEREQADVLIADDEFDTVVEAATQRLPDLRRVRAWTEYQSTRGVTVNGLIDANRGARPARPERAGRIVLLTSGTTGTPKGARRGGSTDVASLAAMLDRIPWRAGESIVIAAPVFHAWGFGQVAIAATMTCTMIMRRRFDPVATLDMVRDHGATGLAVVPVMLERITDLPDNVLDDRPMPTLRFATASGSRMRSDALVAFLDRYGDVVYNSYNATEAGLITTATPADLRTAPETAGRPLAGTSVRILDDDDREVPVGEVGRIVVANNSGFDGYTSSDTKAFSDGHMVSGDVGRFDENGLLFVVGRDDEMIVSGGENVYPLEVELVIGALDEVVEVAVTGVDDDRFGQRLVAHVVRAPEAQIGEEDIQRHVREQLAGFKVPRDVHFLDELPRNATGKILKRELPSAPSTERKVS
ncbi:MULTISPECIES: AMP-binding protein [unclassified Gordonia (in: high G+C Gram-positive bacteria)]|uniref:AMP-binding protein n=1 Tax=unclassified Gordonia (in: high G+C Gram-positive bacteria) TaxID=2657482 RepID=UPI00196690D4|nr:MULTISPECIES: AMP-binding protein [unclassified Gordonia (in: high G+C Gram-positive bacteria)]MBN0973896.1 bile acid CoA ligase [Gordonia sp. BP-119]MBN0984631.1 bile acid CoA ligase [Gordonia sp. BP-94]